MIGSAVLRMVVAAALTAGLNTGAVLAQSKDRAQITTKQYVERAAIGDLFEVESSELALKKAQKSEIQAFARKMVDDHTKSTQKMQQALASGGARIEVPKKLDARHEKMISQLRSESGPKFDQLYLEMQVKAHQDALQLHRSYANSGDNVALQKLAKEVVAVVETHLADVRQIARKSSRS